MNHRLLRLNFPLHALGLPPELSAKFGQDAQNAGLNDEQVLTFLHVLSFAHVAPAPSGSTKRSLGSSNDGWSLIGVGSEHTTFPAGAR